MTGNESDVRLLGVVMGLDGSLLRFPGAISLLIPFSGPLRSGDLGLTSGVGTSSGANYARLGKMFALTSCRCPGSASAFRWMQILAMTSAEQTPELSRPR